MKKMIILCKPNRDNAVVSGYPEKTVERRGNLVFVAHVLPSRLTRSVSKSSEAERKQHKPAHTVGEKGRPGYPQSGSWLCSWRGRPPVGDRRKPLQLKPLERHGLIASAVEQHERVFKDSLSPPHFNGKSAIIGILAGIVAILIVFSFVAKAEQAAGAGKMKQADLKRLEGRWVRPDGGYILELREVKADGSLKAYYFNPGPINVARARIENNKKGISLSVELRDVNYPGSLYNLQYDPGTDRLKGTYFQAVERQTFAIEFVRSK